MVHLLLRAIILSSFIASLFGGQEPVIIFAKVNSDVQKLHYVDQIIIDECNEYNMNATPNSPYFTYCSYSSQDKRIVNTNVFKEFSTMVGQSNHLVSIMEQNKEKIEISEIFNKLQDVNSKRVIPLACFVDKKGDMSLFKQKGEELFSFKKTVKGEEIVFVVKSDADFADKEPNYYIETFKKDVQCLGDEEELLRNNIIVKEDEIKKHSIKGFFSVVDLLQYSREEIKQIKKELEEKIEKIEQMEISHQDDYYQIQKKIKEIQKKIKANQKKIIILIKLLIIGGSLHFLYQIFIWKYKII